MNLPCDCCEGPNVLTPLATANRPGLSALHYRVGTYATFFETMRARLSNGELSELAALKMRETRDPSIAWLDAWAILGDVLTFYQERIANEGYLRTATERRSILELARLLGYALRPGVSASVYLAYSIEKDAAPVEILQGARVNSVPAPGEQMQAFETSEPLQARVEWNTLKPRLTQPQTADSIEKNGLYVKGTATNLKANDPLLIALTNGTVPLLRRIAKVEIDHENQRTRVVLRPINGTRMAVDAVKEVINRYRVVERFNVSTEPAMTKRVLALLTETTHVADAQPHDLAVHLDKNVLPKLAQELKTAEEGHFTKLQPWVATLAAELRSASDRLVALMRREQAVSTGNAEKFSLGQVIDTLGAAPSVPPASAKQLERSVGVTFATSADIVPRLFAVLRPPLQKTFYTAWKNLPPQQAVPIEVYALRVTAAPFGHNAPLRQTGFNNNRAIFGEWDINNPWNKLPNSEPVLNAPAGAADTAPTLTPECHAPDTLYLDNDYDIAPDSLVVIENMNTPIIVVDAAMSIVPRSLAAYGLSGKTMQIKLSTKKWFKDASQEPFSTVRNTRVHAASEKLELVEEPVTADIFGAEIELGDLYEDLDPGRWVIVAGERSDIKDANNGSVAGVRATELVMLASVQQKTRREGKASVVGDTNHTFITFAKPLAYRYKRTTVTIYGNVVKATHGETRREVMGSGDAAKAFQLFQLKQPPLTYVSASTVSGVKTTLEVRVNDVEWHEVSGLAALGPGDRRFITRTDDDAKTAIVFGNGAHGARLPTGQENIKSTYRNGIGKPGNLKAYQLSLLATRPLGVKAVINPIRASGGADKEGRDQARKNAPLAVMALDRLVSTQDYADFARTFGGIGKATAARLTDGRKQLVHVTIAGAEDIPIEETSDLYRNLRDALLRYGDPHLPIVLKVRHRLALVVSAKVRIHPDYLWEALEPKIRQAMLDAFGFEKLELGEDLLLAEAIRVIQGVRGATYVDVDVFDTISESALVKGITEPAAVSLMLSGRIVIEPARVLQHQVVPAQLAYLAPEVPDTLILQELKP